MEPRQKKVTNQWGNSSCNRATCILFKTRDFDFGIFSICAPNEHLDRIKLQNWLTSLPNISWICSCDFNIVERARDKSTGLKFEWKSNEQYIWNILLGKLNLLDPFLI